MIGSILGAIAMVKAEQEEFDRKCSLLPKEEADKLRKKRAQEIKDKTEHRRKIEIAEAGRVRNFWGN